MEIDLGVLGDGKVMLVSSQPLPHIVKRVEYYTDQNLMMLVYHPAEGGRDTDLIEYEIPQSLSQSVEASPDVIIYSLFKDHEPIGYRAPLIKVGEIA